MDWQHAAMVRRVRHAVVLALSIVSAASALAAAGCLSEATRRSTGQLRDCCGAQPSARFVSTPWEQ